jgi:hypothetical protein
LIFLPSIHQVDMKIEPKTFFPISRLYIPTVYLPNGSSRYVGA